MREDWTVDMNILPGEEKKKKEVILLKCNMNEGRREPFERESLGPSPLLRRAEEQ